MRVRKPILFADEFFGQFYHRLNFAKYPHACCWNRLFSRSISKKKPCFGEHSWFWKSTQGLSGKVRFFSTTTPRVAQSTTTTTTTTSWNKRSLLLPQCFPCKSQSQIMSILPWKRTTHFEIFKNSVWLTDPPLAESEKFNRGPRPRVERIAKSRGQSITGVLRKEVFWNTGRENVHIQQHV